MADSKYFGIPFATSGDKVTIPEATQPSGAISFTQGFGPDYERDPATDPLAKRVPRDETNELYFQVTNALKFLQLYGTPEWYPLDDAGNAVTYPLSARVRHDAGGGMQAWRSLVASNTATPGSDATKWALDNPFDIATLEATLAEALAGTLGTKLVTPRRLASSVQRGAWNYAVASGTANALTVTLSPAPATIQNGMEVVLKISTTNTGAATLNLNGLGVLPIVSRRGASLSAGDLVAGAVGSFIAMDGSWVFMPLEASSFRRRLNADTNFYVATTGNDNNDGSVGSPWATLSKAATYLQTQIDLNGYSVTINVANGTYSSPFQLAGYVPGQTGSNKILVLGNVSSPTSCFINSNTVAPFGASNGAAFQVRGFQVSGTSVVAQNGSGIYASTGGIVSYDNMAFNACNFAHVFAELGGYCVSSGPNLINGNCSTHLYAKDAGTISITGRATTLSGTPTFSGAFAAAETGTVEAANATFSGGALGARYFANANGVIKTNGGGANFFPGNAVGSVNAGGQYL